MKNDNNLMTKLKTLENENHLLKRIIRIQKKTIDRLIQQFITNDSTDTKDNL